MRLLAAIVAWSVVASATPAGADIYVWRDESGVSHYTNDLANVPPQFRTTAMTVARDWVRAEPPAERREVAEPITAPSAAPGDLEPSSALLPDDELPALELFEAGVEAGRRSAPVTAVASATSVPVVVMSREPRRDERLLPVVVLPTAPGHGRRRVRVEQEDDDPMPRRFAGPGGPPPLGAAGPSPFQP